tara:strand:+ start:125 stop:592 length:468 start_codon:yes stop_codon:yes gene_type:complete
MGIIKLIYINFELKMPSKKSSRQNASQKEKERIQQENEAFLNSIEPPKRSRNRKRRLRKNFENLASNVSALLKMYSTWCFARLLCRVVVPGEKVRRNMFAPDGLLMSTIALCEAEVRREEQTKVRREELTKIVEQAREKRRLDMLCTESTPVELV